MSFLATKRYNNKKFNRADDTAVDYGVIVV